MNEYCSLGHMSRVDLYAKPHYIMPHHGVFRNHRTTTAKLRVAFNGSQNSSSNISLNELQLVGPPIQGDVFSILLRFRQPKFVACTDIEKVYREVPISDRLECYKLKTVT
ncbi:uncharacterized protein LOC114249349 [Bombyx mandarina]|uniref:Uncharacterized protein LOC114249349 n=1 Tax=Bombyx mandarina TaxID=7092 RepID=A0A6J2KAK2_BOMMA|nr:uncharacterized protein LOC114249349 [Bombyx mandarina]